MNIIRVTKHATDDDIVLLFVPFNLNQQIARFEPARFAPDLRAYLIHREVIPAFYKWARFVGAHVVDDRPVRGEARPGHECAHCQQGGSVNSPPKVCPSCGKPWTPVTHRDTAPIIPTTECGHCHHKQTGRFTYCAQCGHPMEYPDRPVRKLVARNERAHLDDPMLVGDVVRELTE